MERARPAARPEPGPPPPGPVTATSSGSIDLSRYAGREIEVAISYASDDIIQGNGAFVDDVQVSTGEGTTSFEDDGDPLDGGRCPASPGGQCDQPQRLDRRHGRRHPTTGGCRGRRGVRPPAGDHRLPVGPVRSLPLQGRRGHRGRRRRGSASPWRTRPGPSTPASSSGTRSGGQRGRPRAGAPVVRRQPRRGQLAAHLAQRGLRHVRRVAVERARGPRHRAGELRLLLLGHPAGRTLLGS